MEHVVQFDATRRTLPGLEPLRTNGRNIVFPQGTVVEVLHGCRQLVPWGVGLSPATSATLIRSCHPQGGTLRGLLRITERKVGMTSSQHGLYVQGYTRVTMHGADLRTREGELIGENRAQFGLQSAT